MKEQSNNLEDWRRNKNMMDFRRDLELAGYSDTNPITEHLLEILGAWLKATESKLTRFEAFFGSLFDPSFGSCETSAHFLAPPLPPACWFCELWLREPSAFLLAPFWSFSFSALPHLFSGSLWAPIPPRGYGRLFFVEDRHDGVPEFLSR